MNHAELKRIAEGALAHTREDDLEKWDRRHDFGCAITPEVVLALLAENERLRRTISATRTLVSEGAAVDRLIDAVEAPDGGAWTTRVQQEINAVRALKPQQPAQEGS